MNPNWHPRLKEISSDEEWSLIQRGLCPKWKAPAWQGGERCLQASDPVSPYGACPDHAAWAAGEEEDPS